jgi:CTP:molybdopterin cytidylyltransferase MocA
VNATALRAVVLAGGASTRMGAPKALLPVDGAPAVLRVTGAYREVGVEPLVVLGHEPAPVAALLREHGVATVVNERHAEGMFSSVRCGARELGSGTRAFFVHPVDCVLVRPETLAGLARSEAAGRAVVYPGFAGERGHPPLLPLALRQAILAGAPGGGLRELLAGARVEQHHVDVDDPHVLEDMDRPADLERLREDAARERLPGPEECRALLARYDTPAPVVAHAETVAVVAGCLGAALRAAGVCLDLRLLAAAALTHDIIRTATAHASAGAAALDAEGYPRVAAVVRRHMDLPVGEPGEPGEAEVLYLADKLTQGAEVVSLARKEAHAEELFAADADALAGAQRRLTDARAVARRVEECIGRPLAALVADGPGGPAL